MLKATFSFFIVVFFFINGLQSATACMLSDTLRYAYKVDSVQHTRVFMMEGKEVMDFSGSSSLSYPVFEASTVEVKWLSASLQEMRYLLRGDCPVEIPEKDEVIEVQSEDEVEFMGEHFFEGGIYVVRQKKNFVLTYSHSYCYAGGAHGMPYGEYANWDLAQRTRLALRDIFKPSADFLPIIAKEAYTQLHRKYGQDTVNSAEELLEKPEWFENFALEKDGVRVQFQPYAVGPYAIGMPEILVPYSEIRHMMRPDILDMLFGEY
jgi:hypothetical protein